MTTKIYISYSHKDKKWLDQIKVHLKALTLDGTFSIWDDGQIELGQDWRNEIDQVIRESSIVLLLISSDYLSSSYIVDYEVPALLQRREKEGIRVIPIILKPCMWQHTIFGEVQVYPSDGKPLSQMSKAMRDIALSDLAKRLSDLQTNSDYVNSHTQIKLAHKIVKLSVENFRLFEKFEIDLNPNFNLIVGINGSGKSSLLKLISICMSSWVEEIGFRYKKERVIFIKDDLRHWIVEESGELRLNFSIKSKIAIFRQEAMISNNEVTTSQWNTSYQLKNGTNLVKQVEGISEGLNHLLILQQNSNITLPIFTYFRTERLWNPTNGKDKSQLAMEIRYERFDGYSGWANAHTDDKDLMLWVQKLDIIAYQEESQPLGWRVLQLALQTCFEDFQRLAFMAKEGQLVIFFQDGRRLPFNQLSDGQRTLFAMIGDMVRRAVLLNPHLGEKVLEETPGVVLIDELDLHLHPKWQRRIIEDLRHTFPKIQFIATTHSPFLIQSLRSGEELIMLDGQPTAELGNMSLEEIARGIMGVSRPEVSERYEEMKTVARNYLETLELADKTPEDKLEAFKQELAKSIAPYADNPAFQAFLEMKRAAKLGE
jgi:predicted ATP-binding protein involved in virulence